MPLELTFLGTSSMGPTHDRNVQSMVLRHKGQLIVVDCGEGTLRQMEIAGLSSARVTTILITHWHWDHVGGLVGLIQSYAAFSVSKRLKVFGPAGTQAKTASLHGTIESRSGWPVDVYELEPQPDEVSTFLETEESQLRCAAMSHGCPTLAYAFAEKDRFQVNTEAAARLGITAGPRIGELLRRGSVDINGRVIRREECCTRLPGALVAVVPDTTPTDAISKLAAGADLMVCESTYGSDHADLALANHHMTAAQAADAARQAGAKRLILTHFSQRYPDVTPLVEEAHAIFPAVTAAADFQVVGVSV